MSALIEFDEVCKYYQMGDTTVKAADHITMKIEKGEFVAIVGQSGSGKSTCMNIIGCLDVPTHGTYRLNGRDVGKMSRNELAAIRNEMLGFIFQQYNLLPRLNLMENVEVPLVYAGIGRTERHARALLRLEEPELQRMAARHVAEQGLTVARTEEYVETLLHPADKPARKKPTFVIKDVRLFLNTVTRGLSMMKSAGVQANCKRQETEDSILLTITIPK